MSTILPSQEATPLTCPLELSSRGYHLCHYSDIKSSVSLTLPPAQTCSLALPALRSFFTSQAGVPGCVDVFWLWPSQSESFPMLFHHLEYILGLSANARSPRPCLRGLGVKLSSAQQSRVGASGRGGWLLRVSCRHLVDARRLLPSLQEWRRVHPRPRRARRPPAWVAVSWGLHQKPLLPAHTWAVPPMTVDGVT